MGIKQSDNIKLINKKKNILIELIDNKPIKSFEDILPLLSTYRINPKSFRGTGIDKTNKQGFRDLIDNVFNNNPDQIWRKTQKGTQSTSIEESIKTKTFVINDSRYFFEIKRYEKGLYAIYLMIDKTDMNYLSSAKIFLQCTYNDGEHSVSGQEIMFSGPRQKEEEEFLNLQFQIFWDFLVKNKGNVKF